MLSPAWRRAGTHRTLLAEQSGDAEQRTADQVVDEVVSISEPLEGCSPNFSEGS
jgi:hypothetical protein